MKFNELFESFTSRAGAELAKLSDVKVGPVNKGVLAGNARIKLKEPDEYLLVTVEPTAGPLINFMRSLAYGLQRKKYTVLMKSGITLPDWSRFKANGILVKASKDDLMKHIETFLKAHNNSVEKETKYKEDAPKRKKEAQEYNAKRAKERKAELEKEFGKGTWNRVKIRQVGGDDGYQWTLFVDGRERAGGMTKSSAESMQYQAADDIAKKEKLGKYAREEKAYGEFKKKIGLGKKTSEPVQLDDAFIKKVSHAIYRTWAEIEPDAGNISNKDAMELVLDADRMISNRPDDKQREAHKLIMAAIDQHGYEKTFKFLTSKIHL